jgi:carboxyl-terminal processing protease
MNDNQGGAGPVKGYRGVIVLGILCGGLITGGALIHRGLVPAPESANGARLFEQVLKLVEDNYIDSVAEPALYRSAIDGMLQELGDPHTAYLAPRRLDRLTETTTGNYPGLGLEVDARDDGITVVAPIPGGPAEAAGIRTGDRIIAVEGASTRSWTVEEAAKAIRGKPGTSVSITVERPGLALPLPFTLTRKEIHRQAIRRAVMLRDSVGYVAVDVFSEATASELESAIERLRARGARKLIFDLRDNPGGFLEQGVAVTDLFLDSTQKVVEMRGRTPDANHRFLDDKPQKWKGMPLVVLVNEGSASASEIVAGALQDHDRAAIIGRTTFGKGSAQNVVSLPSGGALKVTTALWFTPSGRSINRTDGPDRGRLTGVDGDLLGAVPEGEARPVFRTDAGRAVYGGGGIAPDLVVSASPVSATEIAFARALGTSAPKFRDAVTDYGLSLKAAGTITSPDFVVTSAMLDELWRRMQRRGIDMDRAVYDQASAAVTRVLERDIARYVFSPDAEFLRRARDDEAIRIATDIVAGARDQRDVLTRAEARARALHASAKPDSSAR